MIRMTAMLIAGLGTALSAPAAIAQSAPAEHSTATNSRSTPTAFRDEIMEHFERSTRKLTTLAEAIPEELYTWSPGEEVMSIARVYAHIARYNYMYPATALGVPAPDGRDQPEIEQITDKARVTMLLRESIEHVRQLANRMTEDDLAHPTRLYGRDIAKWAVLLQLVSHMNEHVGQSVAYARMNGIVPPWSR